MVHTLGDQVVRQLKETDREAFELFLTPHLASSLFLLSNARQVGLVDGEERYQGAYAAAFMGEAMVAVAAHYWNGMLILQAPVLLEEVVLGALRSSGRALHGLIGIDDQVQQAKSILGLESARYNIDEADGLYSLQLENMVVPERLQSGELVGRKISHRDLEKLISWRVAYSVELLGSVEDDDLRVQAQESMTEMLHSGQSWILEANGQVVANTSLNAAVKKAVQVGGVYTPPELRGRGYGRAVVAASLLDARQEGVELAVLFTGDSNLPARKAYSALGFQRVADYRLSILGEPKTIS